MLIDYHVHTARCGHAAGETVDYLRVAEEMGLAEIGFSDHMPLLHTVDSRLTMGLDDLPHYVGEIRDIAEVTEIAVRLGIEADYIPETVDELGRVIAGQPFDYVLGSIHFLERWGFDDEIHIAGYDGRDPDELYELYFKTVLDAVETGLFDILAHPDLIKKFDILPQRDLTEYYDELATAMAKRDMAVEVSTAGLRKPVAEIYPTAEFLRICRGRDVPVTLGSDAHAPDEVAYRFDLAVDLLESVGYTELAVYRRRERSSLSI